MSSNGLVHITTASFTAQSSVSINGCFSATYTHYIVKRNLLGSSGNVSLAVRLRVGGADASSSDYRYQYVDVDSTTISASRSTGATSWPQGFGTTQTTAFGYCELWISNPFEAVRTTAWTDHSYDATARPNLDLFMSAHDVSASYDGFTVIPASGSITGSISVWGLVKS